MKNIEKKFEQSNKAFLDQYKRASAIKPNFKTGFTENNDLGNL